VGIILYKQRSDDFADHIKEIQDAQDEEVKRIEAVREEERRQHEENLKQLQETLSMVQAQYDEAKCDLDEKKKQEIIDIVNQYGSNPDELARQLSEVTGFSVILPSR
jgi:predicted nuclease with TOPRIM domain